jgi:hypothetical protein
MPNKPTVVRTNSTPGSIKVVELKVLTFQELWDNYPSGDPYRDPNTGRVPPGYSNQCAIRMSVTFHRLGIAMKSYHRSDRILVDGKGTASRADELAEWLKLRPFAGLPRRRYWKRLGKQSQRTNRNHRVFALLDPTRRRYGERERRPHRSLERLTLDGQ